MAGSVYVLGAGFSHGYSQDFPLVRTFLSLAKANFFYDPDGQHRNLSRVIATYFNDPLYSDIEKILSFLSSPSLHHHTIPYEHRSIAYDELVELIVRTLSKALDYQPSSAQIIEAYDKFAEHLVESKSTIITFNYDLLLEKLLINTNEWHPYQGYGVDIPLLHEAMPTPFHTYLHQKLKEDTDIRWNETTLLKMHGSINWGTPIVTATATGDIYQSTVTNGIPEAELVLKTEFGAPFTMRFKPVIVPPVLDKSSWLSQPSFKVIWNMAMESIASADSITFIGYSLPTTDFMAEFMFRQGVNLYSAERKVTVVDPYVSTVESRYKDVFGSAGMTFLKFIKSDVVGYVNEVLPRL